MDQQLEDLIGVFDLSEQQRAPVLLWDRNVIVSAGAGSGKTRTLVARYAALLYHYKDPRKVVAITFSDKAALEMRSRVRDAIGTLIRSAKSEPDRLFWIGMDQQVDSARISTIHGLCAEIIKSHPAEAAIDPRSRVMEEAEIAALISRTVQQTMAEFANEERFALLFEQMKIRQVETMLRYFIQQRLRVQDTLSSCEPYQQDIAAFFAAYQKDAQLAALRQELDGYSEETLRADNRLELILGLRASLRVADGLIAEGNYEEAVQELYVSRKKWMVTNIGKRTAPSKESLEAFRNRFEEVLDVIDFGSTAPDLLDDPTYAKVRVLVIEMFQRVTANYQSALLDGQMIDFDGLEYHALKLLEKPLVRQHWQGQIESLLVDEFQDTNTRQRDLVDYLTADRPGKLFMVGDARQSIYRFRQADVTVFKEVRKRTMTNGHSLQLDVSYRTHEALVQAMGVVLAPIMGEDEEQAAPYEIQYTELVAHRKDLPGHIELPVVEYLVAKGHKLDKPRVSMGRMLAERLLQMKHSGEIKQWDDVAVLCRSSRSYVFFESAFEEHGIPYVTSAGRGFYDRAEVRDVLNMLRALADPSDDLALAGYLRSPAMGISDASLLQLRRGGSTGQQPGSPVRLLQAMGKNQPSLPTQQQAALEQAAATYNRLLGMVDRVPVYELLKELLDCTHYRSILAFSQGQEDSGREWRNIDKLVNECRAAGHLVLKEYLDFIDALDEDGVRTGEAPAEAIGAVTIMSIHKSKGLEYPVVVLGDTNRDSQKKGAVVFLDPRSGLVFRTLNNSLHYCVAKKLEEAQEQAEMNRLLYVALTRAEDKLILTGHIHVNGNRETKNGWLAQMDDVLKFTSQAGDYEKEYGRSRYRFQVVDVPVQAPGRALGMPNFRPTQPAGEWQRQPLYAPLPKPAVRGAVAVQGAPAQKYSTGFFGDISGKVAGSIVHKAIELGLNPAGAKYTKLAWRMCQAAGIVDAAQAEHITARAGQMLTRYQAHPIFSQVASAIERHHELPYTYSADGKLQNGIIDLLYRDAAGWTVLDFKTNLISTPEYKAELLQRYSEQLRRYAAVLQTQAGLPVRKVLCFLDDHGQVSLEELG